MLSKPRWPLIWSAAIVLVALALWIALRRHDRAEQLAWINTSELAAHFRPRLFTRLKFKILRLPGPFWQMYMKGRTQILIDARLVAVGPNAFAPPELPAGSYTNEQSVRGWVLSREEFQRLDQQLKTLPGYSVIRGFRLTTMDGGQAQLSDGAPPSLTGQQPAFVGLRIDLLPTVSNHCFELHVGATATETVGALDGSLPGVITNLNAGCVARVTNGAGLILQSPPRGDLLGTNYWLLISPTAIDARGQPKEL
jgi:hypothetical protein